MKFQGGVKEAAKMLAGLSRAAREKVLDLISKKDPHMAQALHKSMYTFDDLQFLTPLMVIELLRSIKVSDMGLALRISTPELKDHILKNIPRGMRQEIEEILNRHKIAAARKRKSLGGGKRQTHCVGGWATLGRKIQNNRANKRAR